MELVAEGKNFRLVQDEELQDVQDFLSDLFPESLKFHQTIKTYLQDRVWDFQFYVSKSWPDDPVILHFPGITGVPGGRLYDSFSVFCPSSRLDSLQLLAEEDQLIDWSRPLFLNFTHSQIVEKIEEFCSHRLGCVEKVRGDIYVCEGGLARGSQKDRRQRRQKRRNGEGKEGGEEEGQTVGKCNKEESAVEEPSGDKEEQSECEAKEPSNDGPDEGGAEGGPEGGGEEADGQAGGEDNETDDEEEEVDEKEDADLDLVDEAQLRQLEPEHAVAIHSLYPANDMESVEVFERLIRALPAFGVFSSDGELAAWMVQSYYGAMFSMQTLPAYRRKGYGLLLARRLTSAVLSRGYVPFVVIRPENSASQSLYAKLGFRRRYETVRAILRPKGWPQGPEEEEAVVPEAGASEGAEEELLTEAEVPQGGARVSNGGGEEDLREAEVPEVGGGD